MQTKIFPYLYIHLVMAVTQVRESALRYIANHPDEFLGFGESLEDPASLKRFLRQNRIDGEYADNLMVQATANAYRISIEIITSDRTGRRNYLTNNHITPRDPAMQHLVIGNVDQVHYVSAQPTLPHLTWGGYSQEEQASLRNTCPIDGPLTWLLNAIKSYENLKDELVENLEGFVEVNTRLERGNDADAKLAWLRNVAKLEIEKPLNCYGSAAEQFFEPLLRSPIAKITKSSICTSDGCPTNEMPDEYPRHRSFTPSFNYGYAPIQDRIQEALKPMTKPCSICGRDRQDNINNLPPVIIVPGDNYRFGDGIPTFLTLTVGEIIHVFNGISEVKFFLM